MNIQSHSLTDTEKMDTIISPDTYFRHHHICLIRVTLSRTTARTSSEQQIPYPHYLQTQTSTKAMLQRRTDLQGDCNDGKAVYFVQLSITVEDDMSPEGQGVTLASP